MIKKSNDKDRPVLQSEFRTDLILTPEAIRRASGIIINGRRYKSFLFSSDVATIMYTDADAILAVYPYTPHPSIIKALSIVAPSPLVAGVGGGVTQGKRSVNIALFADAYGCTAVVLNAAANAETLKAVYEEIDIPVIYTVIAEDQDISGHIAAGASVLNISGGKDTIKIVKKVRAEYPDIPIIATGGGKEKHILETIAAGANAISYTPPSTRDVFQKNMNKYREDLEAELAQNKNKK